LLLLKIKIHFVLKTGHFIHQIGPGGSADPSDPPLDLLMTIVVINSLSL